jgi:hypothetical protein
MSFTTDLQVFTRDAATARLPLVRSILRDLNELNAELRSVDNPDPERVREIDEKALAVEDELVDLGLEFTAPDIVHFPSVIEGRLALLCWTPDDDHVAHWHPMDQGCVSRLPLIEE